MKERGQQSLWDRSRRSGPMRTLLLAGDGPINANMSVRTTVRCKQTRTRNNSWRHRLSRTVTRVGRGIYISFWTNQANSEMFHSSVQSMVVQPLSSNVVFLSLYRNVSLRSFRYQCVKKKTLRKTESSLTSVQASALPPAVPAASCACAQHTGDVRIQLPALVCSPIPQC